MKNTVKFIFQDKPELMLECEESKLALNVERWKRTLKLTYNAKYDIVPNDYTVTVVDPNPTSGDSIGDADQPKTLPKRTRPAKAKQEATELFSVSDLLDIDAIPSDDVANESTDSNSSIAE